MDKKTITSVGILSGVVLFLGAAFFLLKDKNSSKDFFLKRLDSGEKINLATGQDGVNIEAQTGNSKVSIQTSPEENFVESEDVENEKIEKRVSNSVLIFDTSGSMAGKLNGISKIQTAKSATMDFIEKIKDISGAYLGIIVYGHVGSSKLVDKAVSCAGIEEIYFLDVVKPTIIKSKIDALAPLGWTPIADSLEKAKNVLLKNSAEGVKNSVILVSDGEETCGGDPIKKAQELCALNINIKTNVIGFNVSGKEESQLRAIAKAGCGEYYSANNKEELDNAFIRIKNDSVEININNNNVDINTPGVNLNVDNIDENGNLKYNLDAPNAKINIENEDINIDVPNLEINL